MSCKKYRKSNAVHKCSTESTIIYRIKPKLSKLCQKTNPFLTEIKQLIYFNFNLNLNQWSHEFYVLRLPKVLTLLKISKCNQQKSPLKLFCFTVRHWQWHLSTTTVCKVSVKNVKKRECIKSHVLVPCNIGRIDLLIWYLFLSSPNV